MATSIATVQSSKNMKQQALQEPLSLTQQQQQYNHQSNQYNQHSINPQHFDGQCQFDDEMNIKQTPQVISLFNPLSYSQTEQVKINNTHYIGYNQHILSNNLNTKNNSKKGQQQINYNEIFNSNHIGYIKTSNQDFHLNKQKTHISWQQQMNKCFILSQQDPQQQLYQQNFQQNIGRIDNSIPYQQIQSQWFHFHNHNQVNHKTKLQNHNHNQNNLLLHESPLYHPQISSNYNQQLQKQQSSSDESGSPSQVLLVMVFELKDLQIANDQIQQIFSQYGFVNKVLIFLKNPDSTKAFVEMDSVESAKKAKEALNKQKILLTPHQKYKFKVHYSQTTELNLCNFKTEGKDYRLSQTQSSINMNESPINSISSFSDIHLDAQGNQIQKIAKQSQSSHSNFQNVTYNSNNEITNQAKQVRNNQFPSSQKSISSPINKNQIGLGNRVNSQSDNISSQKIIKNQHQDCKSNLNATGQSAGVVTYIEKIEQNTQIKGDVLQPYNTAIAPPKFSSQIQQNLDLSYQDALQQDNLDFQNIMQSFTSASTPTSQGNKSGQNKQMTFSLSEINSNDNEECVGISQKIFQPFKIPNSKENPLFTENNLFYDDDCIRSRLDSLTINSQSNNFIGDQDIFKGFINGQSSLYQCSNSQQSNKFQSNENLNQNQEQCQNMSEQNLNLIGKTNPSNLNRQQLEISSRKNSFNSEVAYQKLNQQQYNYQTPNTQLIQQLQQKESDKIYHLTPSQTYINSKSTCSTSSPSPFHTSLFGSTPPTIANQQNIQSKQNISKLELLQLAPSDISDQNFLLNSNTHLYSHGQNRYFQFSSQQIQQTPNTFSTLQENIHDITSSTNIRSHNTLQDDINNSQLIVLNLGSKQESNGNLPLQNIQQHIQQQLNEESPVIYIKNIRINELQPENIYNIFRNFGYVHTVLFLRDTKTVLLQYEEANQAKMAISQLNNMQFLGDEQLKISFCKRNSITIPNIQNQKANSQQLEESSQNYIKGSDYYINKNNDPRSRFVVNQNKKNSFYNPASKTVFITNISLQLVQQEQEFLNIFKPYGKVTNKKIITQGKKVTAFIEFDSMQTALKSICYLHNSSYYQKTILN